MKPWLVASVSLFSYIVGVLTAPPIWDNFTRPLPPKVSILQQDSAKTEAAFKALENFK
jgi:hypothetical protein